jgi:hypothetical protein
VGENSTFALHGLGGVESSHERLRLQHWLRRKGRMRRRKKDEERRERKRKTRQCAYWIAA